MRSPRKTTLIYSHAVNVQPLSETNRFNVKFIKVFLIGIVLLSPTSSWSEEITPAHVLAQSQNFKQDLELVRLELGAEKSSENLISVEGASPYEVFYQAMALCKKTSNLRFEWARNAGKCPLS